MDASPLYGTAGERGCTRVPTQGCLDSDTCKQHPRPTLSTGPPLSYSKSTSITLWMATSTFSQRRSTRLHRPHLWVSPQLFTFNGAASGSLSPAMACVSPSIAIEPDSSKRRQASLPFFPARLVKNSAVDALRPGSRRSNQSRPSHGSSTCGRDVAPWVARFDLCSRARGRNSSARAGTQTEIE